MRQILPLMLMLLILRSVAVPVYSQEAQRNQSFAGFWTEFKAAVAKNDKEAVVALTKFPFEYGEAITRPAFIKSYDEIFSKEVRRSLAKAKPVNDYQSYLDAVKEAKKHDTALPHAQQDRGSYSVFCGEDILLFEKVEGKYRFTGVGVND